MVWGAGQAACRAPSPGEGAQKAEQPGEGWLGELPLGTGVEVCTETGCYM